MKNFSKFASSLKGTKILTLVCVVFFIATNTAINAANNRLSISNGCCTARSVIVPFKTEKDSLSHFKYFNFSFMKGTMKDESKANNSILTSAQETGKFFSFEGTHEVQVVIINGNPYFVAVDICNALDLQNTSGRIHCFVDADEYLPYVVSRSGQQRTVNVVNESGLYALIFQSRKPIAKKFRKWVTSEVLPAIRKTGKYEIPSAERLTGHYVQVTGADDNLYMLSLFKAFREFIGEELIGNICTELRFVKKYEAAKTLFPEHRKNLRNTNVKVA